MLATALDTSQTEIISTLLFLAIFFGFCGVLFWFMLDIIGPPIFGAIGYVLLATVALIGTLIEIPGRRKMSRGEKPFKLPFVYRMRGWEIGIPGPDQYQDYQTGVLFDKKRGQFVPIMRLSDSAFDRKLGL